MNPVGHHGLAAWRYGSLLLAPALLLLPACGGDESGTGGGAPAHCLAPELELPDGSCIRPGVPLDGCAEGFTHDDEYGCEPILPAEDCPPGLMAVPGDTECRPVMPCAPGRWGDIPGDATTQYVDGSYTGGGSTGSADQPRTTIQDAVDAALPGAIIAIAAGSYHEDVVISGKPVRLWGVCPEKVEVAGVGVELAAVQVLVAAQGTEVHGVAITGPKFGLGMSGSEHVTADRVWVHDTGSLGVDLQHDLGPTSLALTGSLVEDSHDFGIFVSGSEATVQNTVVRRTAPRQSDQQLGRGIDIEGCRPLDGCNLFVAAAATITGSLVEDSHDLGLFVSGSEVTVQSSVIRRTAPRQSDQAGGRGINIQECSPAQGCDPFVPATATLTGVLVEDSHELGLFVSGSKIVVDGSVVRRTEPQESDQQFGRGVSIEGCRPAQGCDAFVPATVTLAGSLVEDSHELGLFVSGATATVEGTVVRRTVPRQSDQMAGSGVVIQGCMPVDGCDPFVSATATVTGSLVEDSYDMGLFIADAEAAVTGCTIRRTRARPSDGWFGDGIGVIGKGGPATATITGTLIEDSARAVLSSFGADVTIGSSRLRCGAFAMEGEDFGGRPFSFDDLGDVLCGCPEADDPCVAVSAGLPPPEPVQAVP